MVSKDINGFLTLKNLKLMKTREYAHKQLQISNYKIKSVQICESTQFLSQAHNN